MGEWVENLTSCLSNAWLDLHTLVNITRSIKLSVLLASHAVDCLVKCPFCLLIYRILCRFYLVLSTPITGLWLGCSVITKPFVRDFPFRSHFIIGVIEAWRQGGRSFIHIQIANIHSRKQTQYIILSTWKDQKYKTVSETFLLFLAMIRKPVYFERATVNILIGRISFSMLYYCQNNNIEYTYILYM